MLNFRSVSLEAMLIWLYMLFLEAVFEGPEIQSE